jgi:hypothetical protein
MSNLVEHKLASFANHADPPLSRPPCGADRCWLPERCASLYEQNRRRAHHSHMDIITQVDGAG